ncbi:hypothetical protein [Desulfosarcina alkanivorans]|nr:hypothetical protein [Desulfosarcina alkanivorans]
MATLVYLVFRMVRRIRMADNLVRIRKRTYLIFSFCMSGFLTILNIPSMHGYDLYPAGNFLFLPLPGHGADLSPDEMLLLDRLSVAGLAFSNSATYKNIADLKTNLEQRTAELTRDVEARQRIEEVLRASEEKHRLMAENLKDVLWTLPYAIEKLGHAVMCALA